jgi:hypothetical protein
MSQSGLIIERLSVRTTVLEIVCDSETRSKNLYVDWIVTLKYVPKVRTFVWK